MGEFIEKQIRSKLSFRAHCCELFQHFTGSGSGFELRGWLGINV